jgi:hypothetical protein
MMTELMLQADQMPVWTNFFEHLIGLVIPKVVDGDDAFELTLLEQA